MSNLDKLKELLDRLVEDGASNAAVFDDETGGVIYENPGLAAVIAVKDAPSNFGAEGPFFSMSVVTAGDMARSGQDSLKNPRERLLAREADDIVQALKRYGNQFFEEFPGLKDINEEADKNSWSL